MLIKQLEPIKLLSQVKTWLTRESRVFLTAAGVTGIIIILRYIGLLQAWELNALDQLFRLRPPEAKENRILIVGVTENDLQRLQQYPISDQTLATLLNKINAQKPRAIGLDIYRDIAVEPGSKDLEQAFHNIPNLVGIERVIDETIINPPKILKAKDQIGFNDFLVDYDSVVRRGLLYFGDDTEVKYSFALKLALIYLKSYELTSEKISNDLQYIKIGTAIFPRLQSNDNAYVRIDDGGYQILGNFMRNDQFDTVSMSDILDNKVPPALIKDRIVLIGTIAPSIKDFVTFPYNKSKITDFFQAPKLVYGVELHANFVSQILRAVLEQRPSFQVWSKWSEHGWILLWSLLGSALVWSWRSPLKASCGMIVAIATVGGIAYILFLHGYWIPLIPPLMGLLGSAAFVTSFIAYQEQALKRSTDFLQSVIDKIPDPIFVKDQQFRWLILNEAFAEILGYPIKELIGKSDYDFFGSKEADIFRLQDELVLNTATSQENEEEFTNLSGNTYLVATKRSLHKDAAGNIFLVGVMRDITARKLLEAQLRRNAEELTRSNEELKLSENRLRYLANHDPLTGLANRKLFNETLDNLIQWGQHHQKLVGLLFLDLDGFKPVNDTLGHDIGDLLLKVVAQRISNCLRSSDVVSRLGGDEFTVIIPGIKQIPDSVIVADKILATLSQPFMLEGNSITVTASIGISVYPFDGDNRDILIKNADFAMYEAKKMGRNQCQLSENLRSQESKL